MENEPFIEDLTETEEYKQREQTGYTDPTHPTSSEADHDLLHNPGLAD